MEEKTVKELLPEFYKESYEIASRQFSSCLTNLRSINNSIEELEKELEMNNAPYTPGRWPEYK